MIWFEDYLVCPKGWDIAKDRDLVETHIKSPTLEDAFAKYAKQIKNNPEIHQEILKDIKWGIENGYNFTTLDRFIVDRAYEALKAFKEGNSININLESTQLL